MSAKLLKELGIEKENGELKNFEVAFSASHRLTINTPHLLSAHTLSKLLYAIYNKINYLFDYLDYSIVVRKPDFKVSKNIIQEYFSLIFTTPFLWKNKQDLVFFCSQKKTLENFTFQNNIVSLYLCEQQTSTDWKSKLLALKELLAKLGLSAVRFSLKKREKEEKKNTNNLRKNNHIPKVVSLASKKNKLNKTSLLSEWKGRKIFELGVHTKFSTLDGISNPADYAESAKRKNYAALAVTEHYSVQSFPEFSKQQSENLKIIYGCELEVLEDNLPPYIFNHPDSILEQDIDKLIYCVFDLETTGFFSSYNEIIEIGYVIYQNGKIIQEKEYLICPEKEIAPEVFTNWYTSIDPAELKKSPKISEILPILRKDWENCVLVAHNARNFDYGFLKKVWKEKFNEELPHPIIDTLPLSWILFPERKSYSLEKLSRIPGRGKITQAHRALDDSKLLAELLEKLIKTANEKEINQWGKIKALINKDNFPNRGQKVKVLACTQEGLNNLYQLVTISHTTGLFKKPCVFRSDLTKHRQGILIGASGDREGEIFTLFSSFNSEKEMEKKLHFYDYIEVNSPNTFCHLWLNGQIRETELQEMIEKIIKKGEELNIPAIASHNVHYCEKKEKILKEIIVANEGMNGTKHSLYGAATLEGKKDNFESLPQQHLLTLEEMVEHWGFLGDKNLIEKVIFKHPQEIVNRIGKVSVQQPPLNYSTTESSKGEENELIYAYTQKANEMFGNNWPDFVQERIKKEWQIIKGRYVFIYWLAYKIVQKTHQDRSLVGSRGSIGSSFIAYLCGITDLNPLPFYKFCPKCKYVEIYEAKERIYSCYDYKETEKCPNCSLLLTMEGNNLPFETFFGWEGEKTPDIDLNFSGDYQKIVHNYVRQLLGEDSVYRIGTINTLSQQTAEIFWKEHLKLRTKFNSHEHLQALVNSESVTAFQKKNWEKLLKNRSDFREEEWYKEWVDQEKIKELERELSKARREKDNNGRTKEIWEAIRQEKEKPKWEIIEKLKGIKRTTGQHPGGLLITLPNTNIQKYTPLNYPADNRQAEWMTTHFEYSFLSEIFLKVDILGHDEPTILQKLFQLTGKNPAEVPFHDDNIMKLFTSADTLGVPEFGTDFVKRNLLTPLKPTKFSQLVQISGFSHGTNVWTQNQHSIYKNKELALSELIACREDIWKFLVSWGVDNKNAFIATEFIRKGKWEKLSQGIKEEIKSKLNDKEGELYFSILSKIKYIFPKPHAIAYTMTAWRTAFYKVYYPQQFYSVLLTYHATVYDIWLMTLDAAATIFRLDSLLSSLTSYKNSEKELLSIIKVLEELNKEKKRMQRTIGERKGSWDILKKLDIEKILANVQEKINASGDEKLIANLRKNGKTWKMTAKEKDLLFTLKVILEMRLKGLNFALGVDFNESEVKNFKIENNTIYFPFTAIAGIGEKVAVKIIDYRQEKGRITNNWKEELAALLNVNHLKQLENLEKHNLIINL